MSRKSPFGFLFGKNLENLISGIRRRKDEDEKEAFIHEVISECREEVRSPDYDIKTMAVLKLAYLEMLGYDMTWAGFHVIEVMASPAFQQKRIGYIAAMQSFRGDSELLMLVTNLLKMDLVNKNIHTVGVALSGLATIVTPLLAQDVSDDIMRMLSHSNARIRQKAVLALHKITLQYPDIFPQALERISDLLDSAQTELTQAIQAGQAGQDEQYERDQTAVISTAVSVVGEMAYRAESLSQLIELTPRLFAVFVSSKHNWTLIKILKVFLLFSLHEPKVRPKFLPAIKSIMQETESMSVVYECLNCIICGKMVDEDDFELASLLMAHIVLLINGETSLSSQSSLGSLGLVSSEGYKIDWSGDANLRFVALKLLVKMAEINPDFVPNELLASVMATRQRDPALLKRVLALAVASVNDDNFFDIVENLMQLRESFTESESQSLLDIDIDVIKTISALGAVRNYEHVPDFKWYVGVLGKLCMDSYSEVLSSRLLDIAIRVQDAETREAVVETCYSWLSSRVNSSSNKMMLNMAAVFWFIIGEYPTQQVLDNLEDLVKLAALFPIPDVITSLTKLMSKQVARSHFVELDLLKLLIAYLEPLCTNFDFEIQERACESLEVFKLALNTPEKATEILGSELRDMFSCYELVTVAPGTQKKIQPPSNLDLDTPIMNLNLEDDSENPENGNLDLDLDLDLNLNLNGDKEHLFRSSETYSQNYTDANPDLVGQYDQADQFESLESAAPNAENPENPENSNLSQIFDLNAKPTMDTLFAIPKSTQRAKPAKKKVVVAQDATIDGPVIEEEKKTTIFNQPLKNGSLIQPDDKVKVRHKKKSKKNHTKSQPL
ncbi:Apl5 protein [Starmerella bacillaris]|uniref:AP-3 complex subunit delta n=1 Tax=Starmerella bacillaris TaxID=1247836 RepID=A0AAV5RN05_STABA|nr:Apl5 protein [Starmerella bacillaris]